MKKVLTLAVAVLLAGVALPASERLAPAAAEVAAGTVKVTVNYKGKGTVDASHKLWVWVFDSPNIGPGAMPVGQIAIDKNNTDAVFDGITATTVWIAAAFDESGRMMGDAPPPAGTPIGILMSADGMPTGVAPDKDTIVLTFDDSQRMPG